MTKLLTTGGKLVEESTAALMVTMAAHTVARGSVLGTDVGKYGTKVGLALLELLVPPV